MAELAKFIQAEMDKREMSQRQFAKFIKVSPSAVNQHVSETTREDGDPSLAFLRALSRGVGVPLPRLLAIAFPEIKEELGFPTKDDLSDDEYRLLIAYRDWDLSAAAKLFADRATALVQEALGQDAIDAIIKKARS